MLMLLMMLTMLMMTMMVKMLTMLMMLIAMLRQGLAVQSRHLGRTTRINPPSYNPSWAPQGTASHISYLLAPPGPRALYAIKFTYFFHSMNVLHCPGLFWNSSWWLASKYKHATFAINEKSYLKFSTPLSPPHAIIVTRGLHVLHQTAKWILGLLVWWKWVLCGNIILNIITQLPVPLEWKIKKPLLITSISSFIGCSWETFFSVHPRSDTNVKQLAFEIFQIHKSGFSEFLNIWRPDHSGT